MILLKLNSSSFKGVISVQERRTAYEPKKIIKRIKLAGQMLEIDISEVENVIKEVKNEP